MIYYMNGIKIILTKSFISGSLKNMTFHFPFNCHSEKELKEWLNLVGKKLGSKKTGGEYILSSVDLV